VPKIENCLKKYESLLGDPKGMIRTIYAKKSHGDLWVNNLLFAINKENVDVYLIDPMNMAIRIDGDIEYAEFPEGHKSRFSYNHPSDVKPIPDILFDVAQLIASILVSLPYQDTQSNALSELTTETHKNSVLKDKMKVLRKGLLESWTKGNHVTRNTHSFLSIMQKWIEDDLLAGVFLTNEKDIREHMSLLLVDRILYYSGFVLIELQNHEKVHTEFIDYIAQLIDVVLTEPEP
jgi:hypothetical protein